MAIGLLNDLGIEAYPLILSTRDHGKIKFDYPFVHFFNYVIILAKVDGKMILSDATEILGLNDRISPRCINDKGLVINKDKVEWIDLECRVLSTVSTFMQMELSDSNIISADLLKQATEYDALNYRDSFADKM